MKKALSLAAALCLIAPASIAQNANFPAGFLGEWATITDDGNASCRRDDNDGLIRVGRREVEYWESRCSIQFKSGQEHAASISASCAGEGETWKESQIWSRQKLLGHDVLIIASSQTGRASMGVYKKCQ